MTKKTKLIFIPFVIFLVIPLVYAGECGITNLAACIPEKLYEYFLNNRIPQICD